MGFYDLDAFMLAAVSADSHSPDAWRRIASLAIESLSQWLGEQLGHESLDASSYYEGFSIDVFPIVKLAGRPTWRGVLGGTVVNKKPIISLFMFFILGDQRLRTFDGKDYSEFVYEAGSEWKLLGTFADEFGEFENF